MGRSGGGGFSGGFGGGFSGGGWHPWDSKSSGGFSGGFSGGHHSGGRSAGSSSGNGNFSGGGFGSGSFLEGFLLGNLLGGSGRGATPYPNGNPGNNGGHNHGSDNGGGNSGGNGNNDGENENTDSQEIPLNPYRKTMFVLLICIMLFMAYAFVGCGGLFAMYSNSYDTPQITHAREALEAPALVAETYYEDRDGDWIAAPRTLNDALRSFEKKTGVSPYLVILPNGTTSSIQELTDMANEIYSSKFNDKRHMVLVFCDDGDGAFSAGYSVGTEAATVTDEEAMQVLSRFLDRYYNDYSISETEIFANAYAKTADTIMAPPGENAVDAKTETTDFIISCVGLLALFGCVVGFFAFFEGRAERRRKEEEATRKILNTPLEKFGDIELEDLVEKYSEE